MPHHYKNSYKVTEKELVSLSVYNVGFQKCDALNALDDAERMLAEEEVKPDIVFFDMPGTLKSNGVVKTLSQMDYIFAPMSADRFVVESTLQFAVMFRDNLMTTGQAKTKGLYLFWTMVDGREKNGLSPRFLDGRLFL